MHLVDASPYIFRAWFSLPDMEAPDGSPVSAVFGFSRFLGRFLAEESPTHVGLCFDESLTTSFRNDLHPEYKAQRELPPADLVAQLADCQELARALGLAAYASQRYEADDLIATLCRQLGERGHSVVVVTVDKDLAQLVDERVEMFDFAKERRYDAAAVVERFGVRPAQIPDFLGLAGDAVDNIPGVAGVGPKTAVALLAHFDDLDALYADLAAVEELPLRGARSVARRLADHRDEAFLSRTLARLATDAPVRARLDELKWKGPQRERLEPLVERLGLNWLREGAPTPGG